MENSRLEGTPEDHLVDPSVEGLASNKVAQGPSNGVLKISSEGDFITFFGKPISMFTRSHGENFFLKYQDRISSEITCACCLSFCQCVFL